MKVSLEGVGENVVTFEAETQGAGAVTPRAAVKLCGPGKVCACSAAGDIPAGLALSIRSGYAAVQVSGYMKLPCSADLEEGYRTVAWDASGKLAENSAGRGVLVTDVDAPAGVCGIIL